MKFLLSLEYFIYYYTYCVIVELGLVRQYSYYNDRLSGIKH